MFKLYYFTIINKFYNNKNIGDNANIQNVIDNQEIRVTENFTDPININEM